jgi:hypothetical protein
MSVMNAARCRFAHQAPRQRESKRMKLAVLLKEMTTDPDGFLRHYSVMIEAAPRNPVSPPPG